MWEGGFETEFWDECGKVHRYFAILCVVKGDTVGLLSSLLFL
jgi:hypothetical protein